MFVGTLGVRLEHGARPGAVDRNDAAARCFFERAIKLHRVAEKITIDKSSTNTAAIAGVGAGSGADIEMRQSKHLNNLI